MCIRDSPPGAFQSAYEAAREDGYDAVVCVTISAELSSGTYQSATTAALALGGFDVRVVDTRTVTMGQGLVALAAAEAAAAGADAAEIARLAADVAGRTRVYGAIDTLEHLQRGGRIGAARAMLGSMLSIKPIVPVSYTHLDVYKRQLERIRRPGHP